MSETNPSFKPIKLIAAVSNNLGIGVNGNIPWNLPNEYRYFLNKITTVEQTGKKNVLAWGRKSFEKFEEELLPLENSIIALMTRNLSELPKYVDYICRDEEEVVNLVSSPPLSEEVEAIWVLGGVEVYKNMMDHPWCSHIYMTEIMADFECDTFFPEFDKEVYRLKENYPGVPSGIQEENGLKYVFKVYEKDLPK
ncbi:dihydrofolate reductase-like [Hyperolius riggenbachi]|uniref:dihydrofolate reductase-like n=1 Tax=Hyperolius riggenbachi TaxID=752182 RepID=UPI0035A2F4EC